VKEDDMASEVETTRSDDIEARAKQALDREATRPGWVFQPDVDIVETQGEYLLWADLPGADQDSVHIALEDGVLSIAAEGAVHPDPGWRPLELEYRSGGYQRRFALSDRIDAERIEARMRDGVLELKLPKSERHRPRQIEIHAG
jgi:HSP20 family protein